MSLLSSTSNSTTGGPTLLRSTRRDDSASPEASSRVLHRLLQAVDVLLALLVIVLPFIMGGREAWGHRFLITGSLALAACWGLYATVARRRLVLSGFELLFVAGLAVVWFQVQPQTPDEMNRFSPEYERLLPAWSLTQIHNASSDASEHAAVAQEQQSNKQPAAWNTLSFLPEETRHAWWVLLSYLIIAMVTMQRLRTIDDCERMLKCVCIGGVAMTVFAIIQYSLSNGRYFWFYRNPYTGTSELLKGAFTNRNHFAQFLALSIGPLLWWLTKGLRNPQKPAAPAKIRSRKRRPAAARNRSFVESGGVLTVPVTLLLAALCVTVLCVMLSLSRGGMVAATAAFLIAMAGLWRSLKIRTGVSVALIGGAIAVLGLLAVVGQDNFQARVDQIMSGDADTVDPGNARRAIWAADLAAFNAFPIFGTGVGSHAEVYPTYMTDLPEFANTQFSHAESSYINLLMETGLAGISLLALGLLLFLSRLLFGFLRRESAAQRTCIAAVAASATAGILHAVADFIWYVPAIVVTSIVLACAGLRACRKCEEPGGLPAPGIAWLGMTIACLLAMVRVQPNLAARVEAEKHWYSYLTKVYDEQALAAAKEFAYEETNRTRRENLFADILEPATDDDTPKSEIQPVGYQTLLPEDEEPAEDLPVTPDDRMRSVQEKIVLLKAVLAARPTHVHARIALANRLLELFQILQSRSENPFALNQIRDAAVASQFETQSELHEWLRRSFGKNIALAEVADQLARQSLQQCPLVRDAWLTLIETDFLRDTDNSNHQVLVDELLALRQYDPAARYVAGREAIVEQNVGAAIDHWQVVFHASPHHRRGILSLMAPQAPAAFFINLFDPNAEELQDMLAVYDALERPEESAAVLRRLTEVIPAEAREIEDDEERLQLQLVAYAAAVRLVDFAFAESHLRALIEEFPIAYKPRHYLGLVLLQESRFDEARAEFEWCHDRDPGNQWLPKLIVRCRRESLRAAVTDQNDPLRKFRRF
ncbi:MAG: O-antigen ligase family protein [Planctomycetaceae bacterium]